MPDKELQSLYEVYEYSTYHDTWIKWPGRAFLSDQEIKRLKVRVRDVNKSKPPEEI